MLDTKVWFSNLRSIIELLYFIATVGMGIAAFLALRQISTAKKINQFNCKRDALKITAEQCLIFKDEIIPEVWKLNDLIKNKNCTFFDKIVLEKKDSSIKMKIQASKQEKDLGMSFVNDFMPLHNSLEGFAIFFTNGIGDEKVAFDTVGEAYCDIIEQYFPLVVFQEDHNKRAYFKLYLKWALRLHQQSTQEKISKLQQEMDSLKNGKTVQIEYSQPLGTGDF